MLRGPKASPAAWLLMLGWAAIQAPGQPSPKPVGRLEVSATHPHYFRDGERHLVLVGVSDRDALTIWGNDKGFSWRGYLDIMAAHGLNYVRQNVFSWGALKASVDYPSQFSRPAWPLARPGPGLAVDGLPRFDLTRFDQAYFDDRLKPFLREASRRGIHVELTLFEGFLKGSAFAESVYSDDNHVNRLGIGPRFPTSDAALDHDRLRAIQEAYVDKVLEETAGFGNVIFEIANETGGRRWVAHFVDYIHHHPLHPSRLVSAGEQTSAFDPVAGANDIVVKHRGGAGLYASDEDVRRHHDALLTFRVGKPVLHNEYFLYANGSTDDVHFPRKMMWADFTAGGHSNFYDFSFWRGTGRVPGDGRDARAPPRPILEGGQHLLGYLRANEVPFWLMEPHDELVWIEGSNGASGIVTAHVFTLARPGDVYVSYVLGTGVKRVVIELVEGRYRVRWYDPKTGGWLGAGQVVSGSGPRRVEVPPFEQDIVLQVRSSP